VIKKLQDGLKILAHGEITRPIHVTATLFSKAAQEKIKAAGGTATVVEKK
jgi:large subunit ribosomal protein L15